MTNKISLIQPASGFNLTAINSNFQKIEDEFNDKVLYRDNPDGEANTLENDIDANGFTIYNLSDLVVNGSITLNGTDLGLLEHAVADVQTFVDEAESYADEAWASAALIADWSYEGTWTTGVAYEKNNLVNVPSGTYEGWTFIALSDHTAGATFDADYLGGKWGIIAKRGNSGAGTGDLIAANNLSDVANAATARTNLGAHSASNITTGTLPLTYGGTGANTASGARSSLGISATGDSIVTAASVSAVKTVLGTLTDFQNQTGKAYTTAGTSSAFTLTPSPVVTSYAENQEFDVEFHAASSGTPTININALGAKALKLRQPGGSLVSAAALIPSGWRTALVYDGVDMIVREPPLSSSIPNAGTASGSAGSTGLLSDAGHIHPPMSGSVIQKIVSKSATVLGPLSGSLPSDDTIPQTSEGDLIFSFPAFTPKLSSSTILISLRAWGSTSSSFAYPSWAVFSSASSDAIEAGRGSCDNGSGNATKIDVSASETSGSTSARTYTVRVGISGGNWFINGNTTGTRRFGGVSNIVGVIEEIAA